MRRLSDMPCRMPVAPDRTAPGSERNLASVLLTPVFCTQRQVAEFAQQEADRIICVTRFSDRYRVANGSTAGEFMSNQLAMPAITVGVDDPTCEVRLAPQGKTVSYRRWIESDLGVVEESRFGDQQLVRLTLPEHWHANTDSSRWAHATGHDRAPLRHAAFAGYSYLFRRQRSHGLTALRYTNYLPGVIDVDSRYADPGEHAFASTSDGVYTVPPGQRYVSFNHGRFDAWQKSGPKRLYGTTVLCYEPANGRAWVPVCPATTVIGTKNGDLVIEAWYTVSPDVCVRHVNNTRQTTPFRYKARYGRKPPVFARGTYIETTGYTGMIISGTASILKSEVMHDPTQALLGVRESATRSILEDCLRRQLSQTIQNIAFLLSISNLRPQGVGGALTLGDLASIRVYLKHPEHAMLVRDKLASMLPNEIPMILVENDICRPGWLVEIEGLAWRPRD
jgi:hypothetical protein